VLIAYLGLGPLNPRVCQNFRATTSQLKTKKE